MTIQVVILAGGLGTRMARYTSRLPKAMIPVGGVPFLRRQLRWLHGQGVTNVVISIGHLGQLIEQEVDEHAPAGMSVRCVPDGPVLLGTGGAIASLASRGVLEDRFAVTYGDSYLHLDIRRVTATFDSDKYDALMTVWHNRDELAPSNARYESGEVRAYHKRPDAEVPPFEWIDYGFCIFRRSLFATRSAGTRFDLAEVLEETAHRSRLQGFEVTHRFYEIGSEAGLTDVERLVAEESS